MGTSVSPCRHAFKAANGAPVVAVVERTKCQGRAGNELKIQAWLSRKCVGWCARYCSPRHGMPANSRHNDWQVSWMK